MGAEAYDGYRALRDLGGQADALRYIAEAKMSHGDARGAEEALRQMLAAAESAGITRAQAGGYNLLAYALRYQGRYAEAASAALRGMRIAHQAGDVQETFLLGTLAEVAWSAGEYRRALRILRRTLGTHGPQPDLRALAYDLEALASTLSLSGGGAEVFTLIGAARRCRDEVTAPLGAPARRLLEQSLQPALATVSAEERERALRAGARMPIEEVAPFAIQLTRRYAAQQLEETGR
jgi:tetratricopeptide (TPR) repeat protein